MSRRSIMLCLTLLVPVSLGPRAATAQTASLEPGARVRVTSAALHLDHVEGVVREIHNDTLALATPYRHMVLGRVREDTARRSIPLAAVDGLQLPTGSVSNIGRGAKTGGLIGGTVGFVMAIAAMAASEGSDCSFYCLRVGPEAIPYATAVGGLMGGFIGSLVGAMSRHDVWQDVPVPSSATPVTLHIGRAPHGGRTVGVGMTLRF